MKFTSIFFQASESIFAKLFAKVRIIMDIKVLKIKKEGTNRLFPSFTTRYDFLFVGINKACLECRNQVPHPSIVDISHLLHSEWLPS